MGPSVTAASSSSRQLRRRVACAGVLALLVASGAQAQIDRSTVRGLVVDEQGQPLPGVAVALEFKGESRQKILKKTVTDKKGAFIYVGLTPGPWQLTFTKESFKSGRVETWLSSGGISEIPPVTLAVAPAATPGSGMPGIALPPVTGGDAGQKQADRERGLGDKYNKAVEAMRAGQAAEAEALFKEVLAEVPNLAEAHHNIAYIHAQRDDVPVAEAGFRKAIELQPQTSDSYLALATLLARSKRGDEALKLLQDASGNFATDAKFQFALGATAFNLGRVAEAQAAFAKVAELDPAHAEVHFFLGSLAISRSDVPGAIAELEKYVAAAPAGAPNLTAAKSLLATLKKTK
jgi:predicted Zn-dependent protease